MFLPQEDEYPLGEQLEDEPLDGDDGGDDDKNNPVSHRLRHRNLQRSSKTENGSNNKGDNTDNNRIHIRIHSHSHNNRTQALPHYALPDGIAVEKLPQSEAVVKPPPVAGEN